MGELKSKEKKESGDNCGGLIGGYFREGGKGECTYEDGG